MSISPPGAYRKLNSQAKKHYSAHKTVLESNLFGFQVEILDFAHLHLTNNDEYG